ncbi:MAG: DDE-type integrase/transposase/recombinase, partial [Desulfobacter sp.]|nr:DDE-type integrase/transposase/recombinase [Desulfobacter sp.]
SKDKQSVLQLISEVCKSGARKNIAARLLGLTIRTLQRWAKSGMTDKRKGSRATPANKMSDAERQQIIKILESPEFAGLNPNQIVPRLADQGIFLGSESTKYRILSMVMDLYSWKAVACQVYDSESGDLAADLITDACIREKISKDQITLHSDNGSPMKSATMLAKLQDLGVMPSFSRPSVSNDNPFSESLFRTLEYRPEYPEKPFEKIVEARDWAHRFVHWYNTEHLHSSIRFVTPEDRHTGKDFTILKNRHRIYQEAQLRHPERWSGETRNWNPVTEIVLKKFKRLKAEDKVEKKAA